MADSKTFGTDDDRRLSVDGTLEPGKSPSPPILHSWNGRLAPETTPTASSSRSRDTPNSPRPRLFDNLPLPEGPVASDVLSEADYRRLRSNAFRPSVIAGPLLISSALAYFAPRVLPSRSGNPNTLRSGIFLFSLTSILTISTYRQLSTEISGARNRAQDRARPRTADGQVILPDEPTTADKYAEAAAGLGATIGNADLRAALAAKGHQISSGEGQEGGRTDDLASLGKAKARSRWAKGKGLEGEVEEENEMRDTFFRPGVPRKPA